MSSPSRPRSRSRSKTRRNNRTLCRGLGDFHRVFRDVLKLDVNDRNSADRVPSPPGTPTRSLSPKLGNLSKLQVLPFLSRTAKSDRTSTPCTNHKSDTEPQPESDIFSPRSIHLWGVPLLSINHTVNDSSQQTLVEDFPAVDTEGGSFEDCLSKTTTPATSPDLVAENTRLLAQQIKDIVCRNGAVASGNAGAQEGSGVKQLTVECKSSDGRGSEHTPSTVEIWAWTSTKSNPSSLDALQPFCFESSLSISHCDRPEAESSTVGSRRTVSAPLQQGSQQVQPIAAPITLGASAPAFVPALPVPVHSLQFLRVAKNYRADLAVGIVALYNSVALGDNIVLPWDHTGDYTIPLLPEYQRVGFSNTKRRITIEPLYRINKQTQLQLIRARLAIQGIKPASPLLSSLPVIPQQVPPAVQPIHVFVDLSNIVISFCKFCLLCIPDPVPSSHEHQTTRSSKRGASTAKNASSAPKRPSSSAASPPSSSAAAPVRSASWSARRAPENPGKTTCSRPRLKDTPHTSCSASKARSPRCNPTAATAGVITPTTP